MHAPDFQCNPLFRLVSTLHNAVIIREVGLGVKILVLDESLPVIAISWMRSNERVRKPPSSGHPSSYQRRLKETPWLISVRSHRSLISRRVMRPALLMVPTSQTYSLKSADAFILFAAKVRKVLCLTPV